MTRIDEGRNDLAVSTAVAAAPQPDSSGSPQRSDPDPDPHSLRDPSTAAADGAGRQRPAGTPPDRLSVSGASVFDQCRRRWKFRYLDRLPDPAGPAAVSGRFSHDVLEHLMAEAPERRTIERARELARERWPDTETDAEFVALGLDDAEARAFRWTAWKAIEGLWSLEDPTEVDVHATELKVTTQLGEVPFIGYVDRLEYEGDDLVVSDYKSGRPPSQRFADQKLDQVLLYAAAVERVEGTRPRSARLLYLGSTVLQTEVTAERLEESVERLNETWTSLRACLASEEFESVTGPLCAWCPYVNHCPEGAAEVQRRDEAGMVRPDAPALALLA